jgi:hypothetical protein
MDSRKLPSLPLRDPVKEKHTDPSIGELLYESRYREYPNLIEIYVPETSTRTMKPVVPQILHKGRGGHVVDVPKPPVPFSLAPLEQVFSIDLV